MTRLRAMQGLLAILVVVMIWSWTREPPPSPVPEKQTPPRSRRSSAVLPALEPGASVRRNLFEYGLAPLEDAPRPATIITPPPPTPGPIAAADAPAPAVKLLGLVRQGGGLRAALAVHGDVVLAAPGQEVAGYKIVSIDEDVGVVLTDLDGRTIQLQREELK